MFTGIVEETGIIKGFTKSSGGADITVECEKVLVDTVVGDSICVNGCCQTVVSLAENYFCANISNETLKVTNFADVKTGNYVNLERALTPNSRMGGHIVQGHVDCIGHFIKSEKNGNFYTLHFNLPQCEAKYVVYKGSVAVNGVSLTVAQVNENIFTAAVIPHTMESTNLMFLKKGDSVNIETDILGRYVEKFLYVNNNDNTINEDFLLENGFI